MSALAAGAHGLGETYRAGCCCGDCRMAKRRCGAIRRRISSAAQRATELRGSDPAASRDARTAIADLWIAWSFVYHGHADRALPYNPLRG